MDQLIFTTNESPELIIESISGNLRLSGWEQNQIQVDGDPYTTKVDQRDNRFVVTSSSDCSIRIPRQTKVSVKNVSGDMRVKSLQGALEIGSASGDVALRQTGAVNINRVSGDLSAKKITGSLIIKETSGDLSARGVAGDCLVDRVMGDVYLRDVTGNARAQAMGDAILTINFKPNQQYEFKAQGDVLCRLPSGVSATVSAKFNGDVSVDVIGAKIEGSNGQRVITLGDGAAQVKLSAGEDISISSLRGDPDSMGDFGDHFGDDFGVMAEELSAQIESHMADFEKHISHFAGAKGERASARVKEAVERARQKAEAARQRGTARAEAIERRAERASRGKGFGFVFDSSKFAVPRPPSPPKPPSEPVSDEERMMILKMVEQKKISIDEAEKLLSALEGKEK